MKCPSLLLFPRAKDLMLRLADLHTLDAVAAAESAISGYKQVIPSADSSSESKSESEDSSDEEDDDSDHEDDSDEDDDSENGDVKTLSSKKPKRSKSDKDNSSSEVAGDKKFRKRAKIVEL